MRYAKNWLSVNFINLLSEYWLSCCSKLIVKKLNRSSFSWNDAWCRSWPSSRSSKSTLSFQLVRTRSSFSRFILNRLQFLMELVPRSTLLQLLPRALSDRVLRVAAAAAPSFSPPSVSIPQNQCSAITASSFSPDPSQKPASASNVLQPQTLAWGAGP